MSEASSDGVAAGDVPTGLTPYQLAKREQAAFKFALLETVAADPKLAGAPCVSVMLVYLRYLSIDEKTLKPNLVWASNDTLRARGGVKSTESAQRARQLMERAGYLYPDGKTKEGSTKFRIANPHAERVQHHVDIALETYRDQKAFRKEEDRRKQKAKGEGVRETDTPSEPWGAGKPCDRVPDSDTNYLRKHLGEFSSEGEGYTPASEEGNAYALARDCESVEAAAGEQPFPVPRNEAELEASLRSITKGLRNTSPGLLTYFRKELAAGRLTPSTVEQWRSVA